MIGRPCNSVCITQCEDQHQAMRTAHAIPNSLVSMTSSAHAIITHAARLRLPLLSFKHSYAALPCTTRSKSLTSPTIMTSQSTTSSEPLFFWREFEEPYGFLSQWYDSPFEVEGVTYASTEMWMMIQKAKLFGDEVCAVVITRWQKESQKRKKNVSMFSTDFDVCDTAGNSREDDADDRAVRAPSAGEEGEGLQ